MYRESHVKEYYFTINLFNLFSYILFCFIFILFKFMSNKSPKSIMILNQHYNCQKKKDYTCQTSGSWSPDTLFKKQNIIQVSVNKAFVFKIHYLFSSFCSCLSFRTCMEAQHPFFASSFRTESGIDLLEFRKISLLEISSCLPSVAYPNGAY